MKTFAQGLFLKSLEGLRGGSLEMRCGSRTYSFGEPDAPLRASVAVHHPRLFTRALLHGDTGLGEAYMDGDWTSPDPVAVVRLAVRNLDQIERSNRALSALSRGVDYLRHRLRRNTMAGSRRNISAHYDLSSDFFRLFLDRGLTYSCAYSEAPDDSLETAQNQKLDRVCRKLQLTRGDHVLEIGTGWGSFALHAARKYGCRVTTTTISREQHDYARERFAQSGRGRIELLLEDYRDLRGRYDRIASIEMFEAVGLEYYDDFFRACDRLLKSDGAMLLQTITLNERKFAAYRRSSDWIQKYIFPGAELASVVEILRSLARATRLSLLDAEQIGAHYARTLAAWRERFRAQLAAVRALGYDERFIRTWDFYLAFCEGAFRERHTGDFQLLLAKEGPK